MVIIELSIYWFIVIACILSMMFGLTLGLFLGMQMIAYALRQAMKEGKLNEDEVRALLRKL